MLELFSSLLVSQTLQYETNGYSGFEFLRRIGRQLRAKGLTAILVLPGGAGTLDELFEVLTWRQLGLHSKPIALLDTDGYWQPLLALIEHLRDQGFLDPSFLETFSLHPTPKAALDALTP